MKNVYFRHQSIVAGKKVGHEGKVWYAHEYSELIGERKYVPFCSTPVLVVSPISSGEHLEAEYLHHQGRFPLGPVPAEGKLENTWPHFQSRDEQRHLRYNIQHGN